MRSLLDEMLASLNLSSSRRNGEFLVNPLKALSGRLAMRLTSVSNRSSELIALDLLSPRQSTAATVSRERSAAEYCLPFNVTELDGWPIRLCIAHRHRPTARLFDKQLARCNSLSFNLARLPIFGERRAMRCKLAKCRSPFGNGNTAAFVRCWFLGSPLCCKPESASRH